MLQFTYARHAFDAWAWMEPQADLFMVDVLVLHTLCLTTLTAQMHRKDFTACEALSAGKHSTPALTSCPCIVTGTMRQRPLYRLTYPEHTSSHSPAVSLDVQQQGC